jgi:TorA maturation chaperone TorD
MDNRATNGQLKDTLYEDLVGQSLACGLIGKLLYLYPEHEFLQSLVEQNVFDEIPYAAGQVETAQGLELLKRWTEQTGENLTKDAFDDLQVDYCRLFVGPGTLLAPPWESVHRDVTHLTFQKDTVEVRKWYARYGLQFEKLHKEPDDHIGLELAFIAALAGRAAEALAGGEEEQCLELVEAQSRFIREHLLQWGPTWAEMGLEGARTDFYQGVFKLTLGVFAELRRELDVDNDE